MINKEYLPKNTHNFEAFGWIGTKTFVARWYGIWPWYRTWHWSLSQCAWRSCADPLPDRIHMDTMVRPGVSPILVGFWFRISGKFPEKFQGKSGKVGEILLFLARWYGGFTYHFYRNASSKCREIYHILILSKSKQPKELHHWHVETRYLFFWGLDMSYFLPSKNCRYTLKLWNTGKKYVFSVDCSYEYLPNKEFRSISEVGNMIKC